MRWLFLLCIVGCDTVPRPPADEADTARANAIMIHRLSKSLGTCVDQLQKCGLASRIYNGEILAGEERIIACQELREHGVITKASPDTGWARHEKGYVFIVDGVPLFVKQIHNMAGKVVKMPELDGKVWAQYPGHFQRK